ncbi:uncharacterized protein [Cicer arietinum]|uniref:uncharacterized protein n=1 Tax=Cicer arietinum TaxID=3827 RepID=UPI003CC63358
MSPSRTCDCLEPVTVTLSVVFSVAVSRSFVVHSQLPCVRFLLKRELKKEYVSGVKDFVKMALKQPICISKGGIRCLCIKCKCMKISAATTVRLHLYRDVFQPDYWIWTKHGEVKPMVEIKGGSTSSSIVHHDDQFNAMDEMMFDAFRPYRDVLDVNTNMGNETFAEDELHNEDAKRFYDKLISTNKPIYEGATQSMLSICAQLLAIRSNWHVPQKGIDFVTKILQSVCPVPPCLLDKYYQTTQLVSKVGLKVEKIDCCKKGCMLYYKDDNKLSDCKICHSPKFIPRRTESVAEMRWHHENKKSSNVIHHPFDGKAWKHFDDVYPDFASDPRNLRLGLCSDGFTPYIQASASPYSCKTKDNKKARKDLSLLWFRGDLEMQVLSNGKMGKPKTNYTLTSLDAKCADVEKGTIHGMKSHDCHVFMECLLPIAFHSLPEFVWKPLTELSRFFKDLCCNTLRLDDLVKLNDNIPIIICKLEKIFPPGFFDSMEHLPIHLANEAMLGGPVHYRWMYPFERCMGVSKRAVTNKARVEGSICCQPQI